VKAVCFSRAIWVAVVVLALQAQAPLVMAADNCGVPDSYFKGGKPPARLRDPKCLTDACKKAMQDLQAAVDDCYAAQLAEAQKALSDSVPPTGSSKTRWEQKQTDALTALGNPNDGGAQAIKTQKANAAADAKDKDNKGKSAKNILKDKIAKFLKELQDCEANCPPPKEPETPTPKVPGPDDGKQPGGGAKIDPPPPCDIKVPELPKCFKTEKDRQDHRDALDKLQKKAADCKKTYADMGANVPANHELYKAWQNFKAKVQKALEEISDQNFPGDDGQAKIDKVPPCETPTGGGGVKKPGDKPKKAPRVRTGHNISYDDGGAIDDFCNQIAEHKINIDTVGTGETIGHVADLIIENLTDQPIEVTVPPTVLESKSGKNQHYACPKGGDTVEVPPHEKKKVPMDGVCLARNKPPVGDGVQGDLAIPDCDPDSKIPHDKADRMREISQYIYDAADRLEEEGLLDGIPYHDPQKRKDIVVQWSTWMNPDISEITGAPPATKEDLKKVVYKQAGTMTPDKQAKLDDGIDKIFDKIELTTEKAKDLEKADEKADEEQPPMSPGTYNISDETPTPAPQTQEKPKKEKKKKKYPKAIQDWIDAMHAAEQAYQNWLALDSIYRDHLWKWSFKNSPHALELYKKWEEARSKAQAAGASDADKDAEVKARKELYKQLDELEKDYQKTKEGKEEFDTVHEAEKASDKAKEAEKEAEKKLPPLVDKDAIKASEKPVMGKW
jgi:hypothetical protein